MAEISGEAGAFYGPAGIAVSSEAVGTGDGTETDFTLDNTSIISDTVTIYIDGSAVDEDDYTLNLETGALVFDTAPGNTLAVTADYEHFNTVTFTDEATSTSDDLTYTITDSDKRYWDNESGVAVEVDASAVTTGFRVEYAGGRVVFDTAQTGSTITVSGEYYTLEDKLGFFNWVATPEVAMVDSTDFQSDGWTENIAGNKSWTATADQHWRNDESLQYWLGKPLPVSFYVDDSGGNLYRYEGIGYINSDALTVPQGEIANRSTSFTGDGILNYRAG